MIKSKKKPTSSFIILFAGLITSLFLFFPSIGLAQSSIKTIVFQGYLSDTNNVPVTERQNIRFELFDEEIGGNKLWEDDLDNVLIESGVFSVELGDSTTA